VVASQVYHWEGILEEMVDNVNDGTLGGELYEINFANGGLVIEYNDDYALPDEVRELGDKAVEAFENEG
jgi:basic membrane protein A